MKRIYVLAVIKKGIKCAWCIQNVNRQQADVLWLMHFQPKMLKNGRKYMFRDKQTTNNVPLIFFDVIKFLRKRNNCIFGIFQKTSKLQCMHLAVKNLEISSKKDQQWSESTNMFLDFKMQQCRSCSCNYNVNCKIQQN